MLFGWLWGYLAGVGAKFIWRNENEIVTLFAVGAG